MIVFEINVYVYKCIKYMCKPNSVAVLNLNSFCSICDFTVINFISVTERDGRMTVGVLLNLVKQLYALY